MCSFFIYFCSLFSSFACSLLYENCIRVVKRKKWKHVLGVWLLYFCFHSVFVFSRIAPNFVCRYAVCILCGTVLVPLCDLWEPKYFSLTKQSSKTKWNVQPELIISLFVILTMAITTRIQKGKRERSETITWIYVDK